MPEICILLHDIKSPMKAATARGKIFVIQHLVSRRVHELTHRLMLKSTSVSSVGVFVAQAAHISPLANIRYDDPKGVDSRYGSQHDLTPAAARLVVVKSDVS